MVGETREYGEPEVERGRRKTALGRMRGISKVLGATVAQTVQFLLV